MSKFYTTISIESETTESVSRVLNELFGGNFHSDISKACLGIFLDIEDRTEEYQYASEFIDKESMEEDFEYPEDIDLSKFGVEIDLYTSISSIGFQFIDVIADSIAKKLSETLKKRTILRIGDSLEPTFIYLNGKKEHQFIEANSGFFSSRSWIPNMSIE